MAEARSPAQAGANIKRTREALAYATEVGVEVERPGLGNWPLILRVQSFVAAFISSQAQPLDPIFMGPLHFYKSTNMHIPPFISTTIHFHAMIFTILPLYR